jgi:hypothetical protein
MSGFLGYKTVKGIHRAVYKDSKAGTPYYKVGRGMVAVKGFTLKKHAIAPVVRAVQSRPRVPKVKQISAETQARIAALVQCDGAFRLATFKKSAAKCVKSTKTGVMHPRSVICQTDSYTMSPKGRCNLSLIGKSRLRIGLGF